MNVNVLPYISSRLKAIFERSEFQEIRSLPVATLVRRTNLKTLQKVAALKCFEVLQRDLKRPLTHLEKRFVLDRLAGFLESCRPWFQRIFESLGNLPAVWGSIGKGDWVADERLGFVGRVRKVLRKDAPPWNGKLYAVKIEDGRPPILLPGSQIRLFQKRNKI